MRKLTSLASILVFGISFIQMGTCPVRADETQLPPQKWALLVGVDDYTHFRDLEYCQADVMGLKSKLVDVGFSADNVTLLTDGAEQQHHLPFKNNIERQLQLLLATVREQDLVVVAYSGHGLQVNGTSYLCPTDALLSEPEKTMVSLDTIYKMLESCPARQKLLLVDACRNDPSLPGAKSTATMKNAQEFVASLKQPPEGILLLTSCKAGQRSVEDPRFGHGVFLYFLMKGLEGEADANRDGKISLFELYMFSELKTKTHVRNKLNLVQTPVMKGEIAGVYDIGMVPDLVSHSLEAEATNPVAADSGPSATSPLGSESSTAAPTGSQFENPGIKAAIDQADEYFVQGMIDEAIDAYSSVILVDSTNRDLYLKRGSVYLAKGDIEKAVVDYQLGGKPLPLPVTKDSAKLQFGTKVTATVKRGQTLSITKITQLKGRDWLFVDAVDGNDAARGWIRKDAVTGQPAEKTITRPVEVMDVNQPATGPRYDTVPRYDDGSKSRYDPRSPLQRLLEQNRQRQRIFPQRFGGRGR